MSEYRAITITQGSGGFGGPLTVEPKEGKDVLLYITGGGAEPDILPKIVELTGCRPVNGFKTSVPEEEIFLVIIDCGGTLRCGIYPQKRIPTININPVGKSGPMAKYITEDIYVSGVKNDNIALADGSAAPISEAAPAKEEKEDVIDIEAKPEITFEDFGKLQFQVGKIIKCEEVKKSKKLLCSQVQIGSQVRQIVSGIKAHYSAEEMVGKRVMVVTNLKPAKLAGVLSEGMILCAEDADGNLSLMVPEKEMPAGAEIC